MPRRAAAIAVLTSWALLWAVAERPSVSVGEDEARAVTWLTDLDAARAQARESGRPIFAVFT